MHNEKDLLKQWKADLQAIKEEKRRMTMTRHCVPHNLPTCISFYISFYLYQQNIKR